MSASPEFTQALFKRRARRAPAQVLLEQARARGPRSNPAGLRTVFDLKRKDVKLVVGSPRVPVGSYTRIVLRKLAMTSVLTKVVSEEPDVKSIVGKIALGQADAGFVYTTDVRAAPTGSARSRFLPGRSRRCTTRSRSSARASIARPRESWVARLSQGAGEAPAPRVRLRDSSERAPRRVLGGAHGVDRDRDRLPAAPRRRDLRRRAARPAARRLAERRGRRRPARHGEDERDRARARPALRDAGRLPARAAAVPRAGARRDARRAAARPAARGRRGRAPRCVRERSACSAARSTRSASRSRSRRRRS